ncbi:hypothetical protein CK203_074049 [Vitis vinifera]|uniref:Uncharacterized protein n=1 Tax=Vitis vinifera TaxID=29760 RepID=A0A438E887_VITVI|nr:hypothetical protein CK203_074049 [Vitis vinifera]
MCSFLFWVYVTRGAKRGETFMASHRPWDGYQTACRFDSSGLGVWSVSVSGVPLVISLSVHLVDYVSAFVPVASLCRGFGGIVLLVFVEEECIGFVSAPRSTMPTKKDVASSSAAGPSGKSVSGQSYSRKPTDKLNKREFRPFCLHHQEGEKRHLQHVCPYPVSSTSDQPSGFEQGGSQRVRTGQGPWAGLLEHLERDFCPNYSLKLSAGGEEAGGDVEESVSEKGPGKKGRDSSPAVRPPTDNPTQVSEDTSSSPQLDTFHLGTGPSSLSRNSLA